MAYVDDEKRRKIDAFKNKLGFLATQIDVRILVEDLEKNSELVSALTELLGKVDKIKQDFAKVSDDGELALEKIEAIEEEFDYLSIKYGELFDEIMQQVEAIVAGVNRAPVSNDSEGMRVIKELLTSLENPIGLTTPENRRSVKDWLGDSDEDAAMRVAINELQVLQTQVVDKNISAKKARDEYMAIYDRFNAVMRDDKADPNPNPLNVRLELKKKLESVGKELAKYGITVAGNIEETTVDKKKNTKNDMRLLSVALDEFESIASNLYKHDVITDEGKNNLESLYRIIAIFYSGLKDDPGLRNNKQYARLLSRADGLLQRYEGVNFQKVDEVYHGYSVVYLADLAYKHAQKMVKSLDDAIGKGAVNYDIHRQLVAVRGAFVTMENNCGLIDEKRGKMRDGELKQMLSKMYAEQKQYLTNSKTKLYQDYSSLVTNDLSLLMSGLREYLKNENRNQSYNIQMNQDINTILAILMEHRANNYIMMDKADFDAIDQIKNRLAQSNAELVQFVQNKKKSSELMAVVDKAKMQAKLKLSHEDDSGKAGYGNLLGKIKEERAKKKKLVEAELMKRMGDAQVSDNTEKLIKSCEQLYLAGKSNYTRIISNVDIGVTSDTQRNIDGYTDRLNELFELHRECDKYGIDVSENLAALQELLRKNSTDIDFILDEDDVTNIFDRLGEFIDEVNKSLKAKLDASKAQKRKEINAALFPTAQKLVEEMSKAANRGLSEDNHESKRFSAADANYAAYEEHTSLLKSILEYRQGAQVSETLQSHQVQMVELEKWVVQIPAYTQVVADLLDQLSNDMTLFPDDELSSILTRVKEISRESFSTSKNQAEIDQALVAYLNVMNRRLNELSVVGNGDKYYAEYKRLKTISEKLSPGKMQDRMREVVDSHKLHESIASRIERDDIIKNVNTMIKLIESELTDTFDQINRWHDLSANKADNIELFNTIDRSLFLYARRELGEHQDMAAGFSRRIELLHQQVLELRDNLVSGQDDMEVRLDFEDYKTEFLSLEAAISDLNSAYKNFQKIARTDTAQLGAAERQLQSIYIKLAKEGLEKIFDRSKLLTSIITQLSKHATQLSEKSVQLSDNMHSPSVQTTYLGALNSMAEAISPAVFFATEHFNAAFFESMADDAALKNQLTYFIANIPSTFWQNGNVDIEAALKLCETTPVNLKQLYELVDIKAYQKDISATDQVFIAAQAIQDALLYFQIGNATYLAKLLSDGNPSKSRDSERLKALFNGIPEDYFRYGKARALVQLNKAIDNNSLTPEFFKNYLFIDDYDKEAAKTLTKHMSDFNEVIEVQVAKVSEQHAENESILMQHPNYQLFKTVAAHQAELSVHRANLKRNIMINTYAPTPESLESMGVLHKEIAKFVGDVSAFVAENKAKVSVKETSMHKPTTMIASRQKVLLGMESRKPQDKPATKITKPQELPQQPTPSLSNPIVDHLLSWGTKNSHAYREFMISSVGHDPVLQDALKRQLESDSNVLFEILSSSIQKQSDLTEINTKINLFFTDLAKRIESSLNANPAWREKYPEKDNYYMYVSYVQAIKSQVLNKLAELIPSQPAIKQLTAFIDACVPSVTPVHGASPQSSLADKVVVLDNATVGAFKKNQSMHRLISMLDTMSRDYAKEFNRSKHINEMDNLLRAIKQKGMTPEKVIELVQKEFDHQRKSLNSRFALGVKEYKSFGEMINKNANSYHYPRMLALALEDVYQENALLIPSALKNKPRHTEQVSVPQNTKYERYGFKNEASHAPRSTR